MEKYLLIIKADVNDADYVYTHFETNDDTIEWLKPIIAAIKNGPSYSNWENPSKIYAGILTDKQIEEFTDILPYGEDYQKAHTVCGIEVYNISKHENLL